MYSICLQWLKMNNLLHIIYRILLMYEHAVLNFWCHSSSLEIHRWFNKYFKSKVELLDIITIYIYICFWMGKPIVDLNCHINDILYMSTLGTSCFPVRTDQQLQIADYTISFLWILCTGFATSVFKNLNMDSPEVIHLVLTTLLVKVILARIIICCRRAIF